MYEGIYCKKCNYYNKYKYLKKSGTCHLCNEVLDERAYFRRMMINKLHLVKKGQLAKWK